MLIAQGALPVGIVPLAAARHGRAAVTAVAAAENQSAALRQSTNGLPMLVLDGENSVRQTASQNGGGNQQRHADGVERTQRMASATIASAACVLVFAEKCTLSSTTIPRLSRPPQVAVSSGPEQPHKPYLGGEANIRIMLIKPSPGRRAAISGSEYLQRNTGACNMP